MKANFTQQEILLITGTSFSLRESCKTAECDTYNQLNEKEKLEAACRNGLLPGMLPEIFGQHAISKKLHLWKMTEGSFFIEIKCDELNSELEMEFSIDPYSFLAMQILS